MSLHRLDREALFGIRIAWAGIVLLVVGWAAGSAPTWATVVLLLWGIATAILAGMFATSFARWRHAAGAAEEARYAHDRARRFRDDIDGAIKDAKARAEEWTQ